ncbi:hypothetical protein JCM11491_003460, partial [Sporobolomyces phaffii]
FIYALRWTITFLVIAGVYLAGVRLGWCPNYVALWSASLSEKFTVPSSPPPPPLGGGGKIEL